jgi:AraC-like DNA-binding protein
MPTILRSTPPEPEHARQLLFQGVGVRVEDFRCRAHVAGVGGEEPNPAHSIVFVRRGVFGRRHRGESLVADANQILFFHSGEPYAYSHPVPGGDDCTILVLEPDTAVEAVSRISPQAADHPESPFGRPSVLGGRTSARLHHELLAALRTQAPALAVEDLLAELILCALRETDTPRVETRSPRTARRHTEAVEETKLRLNRDVERPPRLAEIAAAVECSPFHLSRTFHEVTGLSLRAYLQRLRARLAAERLASGERDLTDLALDLGYADHAHFTNAFRREWGVPPSRMRVTG